MDVKKIWCKAVVMAGIFLMVPGFAGAFCLVNNTSELLHGRSLDITGFEADIAPGGVICCDDCVKDDQSAVYLLVVTGYVPVAQRSQPGWKAECRIRIPAQGQVLVTGSESHINCVVGNAQ